jgi:sugar phosphate isomerase/epimerase
MLSIATDYAHDAGSPEPALKAIADAGFTHIHWAHHCFSDFYYHPSEIEQIARWLQEYHLILSDLHGSQGQEKDWTHLEEYRRRAGVQLVANRIEMTARLGGDAVVMHMFPEALEPAANAAYWRQCWKTFDELEPVCRRHNIRLAIENVGPAEPACAYCFDTIGMVFARYAPDYLGLCYDCGHGNFAKDGLDQLDRYKDRLTVIHLHDNDGTRDQHKLPFLGTVDWPRLARLITRSAYRKDITTLEVGMKNSGIPEAAPFLQAAHTAAARFEQMIHSAR